MEQIPSWDANRPSTTHEIPRTLRNPEVHHRIHKSPTPFPILSQIDPVPAPPPQPNLLKIHFNIILSSDIFTNPISNIM